MVGHGPASNSADPFRPPPQITKNGHSYERATLYEHLKRSPTDPLTRDVLTINDLRSNYGLKAACDEFWESGASEWIYDW